MNGTVLLLGGEGQLGRELQVALSQESWEIVAPSAESFDVSNAVDVAKIIVKEYGPLAWCINCAAYTAVDQAEQEPDACFLVNAYGPSILSKACATSGTRLIHISTDFVFDGDSETPYREDDPVHPIGVYARSKAEGESAVLAGSADAIVLRTAWLFGRYGKNFPKTIVAAHRAGKPLRVVNDQVGSPTSAQALAGWIIHLLQNPVPGGIYHAAGPEIMSWFDLAVESIAADYRIGGEEPPASLALEPCSSSEYPTAAVRPKFSALNSGKLLEWGLPKMPPIAASLEQMFLDLSEIEYRD